MVSPSCSPAHFITATQRLHAFHSLSRPNFGYEKFDYSFIGFSKKLSILIFALKTQDFLKTS
jgi:hypothetical protein